MAPKEPINSAPISMECLGDDMKAKCKPPIFSTRTRGAKQKQVDFFCNFVSISHDLNLAKNAKNGIYKKKKKPLQAGAVLKNQEISIQP